MKRDFSDGITSATAAKAVEEVALLLGELGVDEGYFLERGLVKFEDVVATGGELVVVQVDADGREHELVDAAAVAWREMMAAALGDGCELLMVSAYRSVERQGEIVRGKFLRGLGADEIFAVSAPPGFSEHHTGRAVDISTPGYAALEEEFEESAAFGWLGENAGRFGFTMTYGRENAYGFLYEPWHWVFLEGDTLKDKG
ncbi:MAG: D-alanyl-D-alanine carboxypeptidase [Cryomorphaceae bacterium]|jgi:D-alanyl-D-alanine carboxypeptidase